MKVKSSENFDYDNISLLPSQKNFFQGFNFQQTVTMRPVQVQNPVKLNENKPRH